MVLYPTPPFIQVRRIAPLSWIWFCPISLEVIDPDWVRAERERNVTLATKIPKCHSNLDCKRARDMEAQVLLFELWPLSLALCLIPAGAPVTEEDSAKEIMLWG